MFNSLLRSNGIEFNWDSDMICILTRSQITYMYRLIFFNTLLFRETKIFGLFRS